MKTLTDENESRLSRRIGNTRLGFTWLLAAGAIIGACSGPSFAQASLVAPDPQSEVTATRQRRSTIEVSNNDGIKAASVERQPAGRTERRVLVHSKSLLVRAAVVEDKLLKRPEFRQLGFVITRDESDADSILELRHDQLRGGRKLGVFGVSCEHMNALSLMIVFPDHEAMIVHP